MSAVEGGATACSTDIELFLHPLLDEPPKRGSVGDDVWRAYEGLLARARAACSACPLLVDCMYKAVVQADVCGFVGCTTQDDRTRMRKALAVDVRPEELDQYAGTRGSGQPVDHAEVLRIRAQHPDDSLEALAERLGCSLSTVKRHLRRARHATAAEDETTISLPDVDDVLDAFEAVVQPKLLA